MDYLICTRNKKAQRFGSEPGPTRFLKVPAQATQPLPKHAMNRKVLWVDEVLSHSKGGANPEDPLPAGDILFFVHGYNNSPKVVLERQRLLSKDLKGQGFDGVVVGFDWPSGSSALNYLEDRSDARRTALQLVNDGIKRFAARQVVGCNVNLHMLAHSTGAFVIREAFDDADDTASIANISWTVSQMVFIAADVSRKAMCLGDSKSSSIYRHCVRLTNYSNPFDKVLKLSNIKRVGVAPRAGRVGLPEDADEKAVDINCGHHFSNLDERTEAIGSWSHSWHIGDPQFTHDLLHTLRGDVDRNCLETRESDGQSGLRLKRP
jgi:hypothetical protein